MTWLTFGFSAFFILLGLFLFIVGIIGIYKFKFVLNKMHSAALLDTMGLFCIVLGLAIANGFNATSIKLFFIVIFLWLTSPISSHFISKLEVLTDDQVKNEVNQTRTNDEEIEQKKEGDN
ncbi:MAG: cation:proton antiporter [Bacilli bacterium]